MKKIHPRKIRLEASSVCQLRCPSCSAAQQKIEPVVGFGFLSFRHFRKLLDENPELKEVELSNYGEIFLNPELDSIIRYANEKKVRLKAANGVNFNTVSPEILETLVKHRFNLLSISLDGASPETYRQYRVKGNFDTVISNIKVVNKYKQQYRSRFPHLVWQFVIFGHNEHELPLAKQMARQMDMVFVPKLSWNPFFSPVRNPEFVKSQSGLAAADCEEDWKIRGPEYGASFCRMLWDEPQINWDGKVLGCCCNYWRTFSGNAFTDGLTEAVNNESIAYARLMLQGARPPREDIPCTTCDLYLNRAESRQWLKRGAGRMVFRLRNWLGEKIRHKKDIKCDQDQ